MDEKIDFIIRSLKSIKKEKDETKKLNMVRGVFYIFREYFKS